jgi:DNA mismatch repair protein MutS2
MTLPLRQPLYAVCVANQVLSDVGDGQSLQQNLSTFSAHVRRLRLMLGAVTPQSLALLDEVGSGAQRFRPIAVRPAIPWIYLELLTA